MNLESKVVNDWSPTRQTDPRIYPLAVLSTTQAQRLDKQVYSPGYSTEYFELHFWVALSNEL